MPWWGILLLMESECGAQDTTGSPSRVKDTEEAMDFAEWLCLTAMMMEHSKAKEASDASS